MTLAARFPAGFFDGSAGWMAATERAGVSVVELPAKFRNDVPPG